MSTTSPHFNPWDYFSSLTSVDNYQSVVPCARTAYSDILGGPNARDAQNCDEKKDPGVFGLCLCNTYGSVLQSTIAQAVTVWGCSTDIETAASAAVSLFSDFCTSALHAASTEAFGGPSVSLTGLPPVGAALFTPSSTPGFPGPSSTLAGTLTSTASRGITTGQSSLIPVQSGGPSSAPSDASSEGGVAGGDSTGGIGKGSIAAIVLGCLAALFLILLVLTLLGIIPQRTRKARSKQSSVTGVGASSSTGDSSRASGYPARTENPQMTRPTAPATRSSAEFNPRYSNGHLQPHQPHQLSSGLSNDGSIRSATVVNSVTGWLNQQRTGDGSMHRPSERTN